MNKVELTGRVARDVTLKDTTKGQHVIMNAITVQRPFKDVDKIRSRLYKFFII